MTTKSEITLRFTIETLLAGFLGLLVPFWAINAVVFLRSPDQDWGELGFVPTTILLSFFLSLGYAVSFLLIFLPWIWIKHRKHLWNMRLMEASIGGIVFGIAVSIFSLIALSCIMGGSFFTGFTTELAGFCSTNGVCWPISAMISGVVIFALAAYRTSAGPDQI